MSSLDILGTAERWLKEGRETALATVVETWGSAPQPIGSKLVVDSSGNFEGSVSGGCVEGAVIAEARAAIRNNRPTTLTFGVSDEQVWDVGLACGGTIRVFVESLTGGTNDDRLHEIGDLIECIEQRTPVARVIDLANGNSRLVRADAPVSGDSPADYVTKALLEGRSRLSEEHGDNIFVDVFPPPLKIVIVGAVHIAQELIPLARALGYTVTIVDPRKGFASEARFPGASLDTRWPNEALTEAGIDRQTAICVLTHDPKIDDPALIAALASDALYVGALGSRRSHEKRVSRLTEQGLEARDIARIRAPIGLAIGAKGATEIAFAIIAEIVDTFRNQRHAGMDAAGRAEPEPLPRAAGAI